MQMCFRGPFRRTPVAILQPLAVADLRTAVARAVVLVTREPLCLPVVRTRIIGAVTVAFPHGTPPDVKKRKTGCKAHADQRDASAVASSNGVRCSSRPERVMGIEPTFLACEARVLPLNYTRAHRLYGHAPHRGNAPGVERHRFAPGCRGLLDSPRVPCVHRPFPRWLHSSPSSPPRQARAHR